MGGGEGSVQDGGSRGLPEACSGPETQRIDCETCLGYRPSVWLWWVGGGERGGGGCERGGDENGLDHQEQLLPHNYLYSPLMNHGNYVTSSPFKHGRWKKMYPYIPL